MRASAVLAFVVFCAAGVQACPAASGDVESNNSAQSQREEIRAEINKLADAEDWRETKEIKQTLVRFGEPAHALILKHAWKSESERTRLACFQIATEHFPKAAQEIVIERGLEDNDANVRYHCAWHCGEAMLYESHRALRQMMDDQLQPAFIRNAATKSLAQLGEADVINQVIMLLSSNRVDHRMAGNAAAKALTGKNLEDFGDYQQLEGSAISGNVELVIEPSHVATAFEHSSKRLKAIADFLRWLEKEKPKIFKHL